MKQSECFMIHQSSSGMCVSVSCVTFIGMTQSYWGVNEVPDVGRGALWQGWW